MKRWLQRGLLVLVPVALIALAWLPALDAPYQYDDHVTPLKDPASQSLTRWQQALPRTLRPLTKLSFACESSLGASAAPARRVLNSVLFLLTAGLLALLAHACGLAPLPAVGLASLWAVHPVHAETLIALAGRSVLLSLCLMLLSALCLLRGRFAAALSCAVLAVLARETAWPWLAACAALAVWQRARDVKRVIAALVVASLAGGTLVLASSRLRMLLLDSFRDPHALNRLGLQWAALPRGTAMLLFDPAGFTLHIDFSPSGWARVGYLTAALARQLAAAPCCISPAMAP